MNKRREKAIVAALLRFEEQRLNEAGGSILDPNNEKHKLIFDIENTPHAFVIGCVLDKMISAEKAWAGPYKLKQRIKLKQRSGDFSFSNLRRFTQDDWKKYLGPQDNDPKCIHWLWKTIMPKALESAMQVIERYSKDGDARCMWTGDNLLGEDVVGRFKKIHGVGDKIANMAVRILVTRFEQKIETASIDVSVDVHVSRVFPRLGLVNIDKNMSKGKIKKLIVDKARELHPAFPAEIDPPLFIVGRNFCHEKNPNCGDCPMKKLCEYAHRRHRK